MAEGIEGPILVPNYYAKSPKSKSNKKTRLSAFVGIVLCSWEKTSTPNFGAIAGT
jgi:hypothetical protein